MGLTLIPRGINVNPINPPLLLFLGFVAAGAGESVSMGHSHGVHGALAQGRLENSSGRPTAARRMPGLTCKGPG
jgi:hypothetical protein